MHASPLSHSAAEISLPAHPQSPLPFSSAETSTAIRDSSSTIVWRHWNLGMYFALSAEVTGKRVRTKGSIHTFRKGVLYVTRTPNRPHDPPHADGTPDAPSVATGHHHCGGACPPGPDYYTRRRWHAALQRSRHGRDQPALCL